MNRLRRGQPERDQNQLLTTLPDTVWRGWRSVIEPVELARGQKLGATQQLPAWVYFPTTVIASMSCLTPNGESAEIAVAGNDSVGGVPMQTGTDRWTMQAVVQSGGLALRPSFATGAGTSWCSIDNGLINASAKVMPSPSGSTGVCNSCHWRLDSSHL